MEWAGAVSGRNIEMIVGAKKKNTRAMAHPATDAIRRLNFRVKLYGLERY